MTKKNEMPVGVRIGESIFDISYLVFDLIAAILFFKHASDRTFLLFGILTACLGGGDAFHLIPRVRMHLKGKDPKTTYWLGLGKAITSITMTVFYIILYYIWKNLFPEINAPAILEILIWITAIFRIVVCLMPQNQWTTGQDNRKMSLLRNIPFAITGLCIIILFSISGNAHSYGLWKISVAVAGSFAFYLPVTLYASQKPAIGALMLPKTMMYIWIISMGLKLI